mmetsp:Transcript_33193/g.39757  ORF Transcript_33193/g.39757 Transcript_33193/m.39757 type:complete len:206 (+) Transcript_33193:2-619(+)
MHFQRINSHKTRTLKENALRAPLIYSTIIRNEMLSPVKSKCLRRSMTGAEELKLLGHAKKFTAGYHGLLKLITTPFPFPLVQMSRTTLFVWLFTLPLTIVNVADASPWGDMFMIFILTYGFLGLEYVSVEMSDPFANDDNDYDILVMGQRVYENISIALLDCDGQEAVENLRETMSVIVSSRRKCAKFGDCERAKFALSEEISNF